MTRHYEGADVAELRDFKLNPKAADPATPVVSVPWYNTVTNQIKYFDGSAVRILATSVDLANLSATISSINRFRGSWDASTGIPTAAGSTVLPGTSIKAGDFWRVSLPGIISGFPGVTALTPGDVIFASVNGASTAANFFAVQANADLVNTTIRDVVTVATVPANTATFATPTLLSGGKISDYMILDSTGLDITGDQVVTVDQVVPRISITSLTALSNLTVNFTGTSVND